MELQTFRQWYLSHPASQVYAMKLKIRAEAVLTDSQFNNYLSERSTPTDAVQKKINEIAGKTLLYPKNKSTAPTAKRRGKYSVEPTEKLF